MPNQQPSARHQVGAQPQPNSQQSAPTANNQTQQQSSQTINFAQQDFNQAARTQPEPQQVRTKTRVNNQPNTQQTATGQSQRYTQQPSQQQRSRNQQSHQSQQQTQAPNQNQAYQQTQKPNSRANTETNNQDQTQSQNQANQDNYYAQYQPEESKVAPGMYKPLPEETLLEWQGPSRPFKKRNKKYHSTIVLIAVLISLILGFAGQLIAVTVVIAVAFLAYALSVVPPQDVTYKITTYGVRIENNLYYWQELGRYWFDEKFKQKLLQIETVRFPGRVTILLANQNQDIIDLVLSEVLLNEKPQPTLYEKAAAWLQEKIPLDSADDQEEKQDSKQAQSAVEPTPRTKPAKTAQASNSNI